jgi:hypothetical protein
MSVNCFVKVKRALFVESKDPVNDPEDIQHLNVCFALNQVCRDTPFLMLIEKSLCWAYCGDSVICQLVYKVNDSSELQTSLKSAQIETVVFGTVGPVPATASVSLLRTIISPIASSCILFDKEPNSVKFVVSAAQLHLVQRIPYFIPGKRAVWRICNPDGQFVKPLESKTANKTSPTVTPKPTVKTVVKPATTSVIAPVLAKGQPKEPVKPEMKSGFDPEQQRALIAMIQSFQEDNNKLYLSFQRPPASKTLES